MKNIVCPLSTERIDENIPRVIGFFVVILSILYVISGLWVIPTLLVVDFYVRAFGNGKYSLLAGIARVVNTSYLNNGRKTDKAPKVFAARLGLVFTVLILVLNLAGFQMVSNSLAILLIVFATLECVANFCVGCIVFSWFVKPYTR
ncbi:DUF4395 domain-containing protein [Saccharicrinis sp. 156]|uniref:DUF4395 domain-containing protein n=1 Tax=Saccharicrinis sp. 156 TaxID=3417574 RepID=UPI003D34BA3F